MKIIAAACICIALAVGFSPHIEAGAYWSCTKWHGDDTAENQYEAWSLCNGLRAYGKKQRAVMKVEDWNDQEDTRLIYGPWRYRARWSKAVADASKWHMIANWYQIADA